MASPEATGTSRTNRPQLRFTRVPALLGPDGTEHPLKPDDAALLLLLARRGPCDRKALSLLLRPGRGERQARNSLRQDLHRLGRQIGVPLVGGTRAQAQLLPEVQHDVGDPYPLLVADPAALDGDLLGVMRFDMQPELGAAIEAECQQWQAARSSAWQRLCAEHERDGRIALALAFVSRLAAEDPLSEHTLRLSMRLHHRRGDRAAALGAYEAFKGRLYAQLGETPADETAELERQIAAEAVPGVLPVPALPLALRHPPRTVGRERLMLQVARRLADGGTALLVGPAGIGKTRVFDSLVGQHGGALVVHAGADEQLLPLTLLARIAQALLAVAPPGSAVARDPVLQWLASDRAKPAPGTLPEGRLTEVFLAALREAQRGGCRLLAIEDLHFADAQSLQVLVRLWGGSAGLACLLSCRDQEVPAPVLEWLDRLPPAREAQFTLAPLAAADIEVLLATLQLDVGDAPVWARALAAHCGGHPLTTLQVLQTLHDSGQLGAHAPPPQLPVPQAAMQRVTRRLDACEAGPQRLAFLAAVSGSDFSATLARKALRCRPSALAVHWRRLQALGLFDENGFSHELLRRVVLDMLAPVLTAGLHAEVAGALKAIGAAPARLARHWRAAAMWPQAARALQAAAGEALSLGQRTHARDLLVSAADCLGRAGQPDAAFELRARVVPLTLSLLSAELAREEAQALHDEASTPRQHCVAALLLAQVLSETRDPAGGDWADRAHGLATELGDRALLARAGLRQVVALHVAARPAQALARLRGLTRLRGALDPAEREELFDAHAVLLGALGRRRESVAIWLRSLDAARAGSDVARTAEFAGNAAIQLGYLCESEQALVLAEEALALDRRVDAQFSFSAVNDLSVAGLCCDTGRLARALEVGERCVAALRPSGLPHFSASAENTLATTFMYLGRPDQALRRLGPIDAAAPAWVHALRAATLATLAHWRGSPPLPAARQALHLIEADGDGVVPYARWRVQLEAQRFVSPQACIETAQACAAWAGANEHEALVRKATIFEIEALLGLGQAAAAAERADALVQRIGQTWNAYNFYLPEAWLTLARAWAAAGQRGKADATVRRAREWLTARLECDVPAAFAANFQRGNPVNEALLLGRLTIR